MSRPSGPLCASTSTACFTNAASTDHTTAVAAPSRAARRAGEPRRASRNRASTARPQMPMAAIHRPAAASCVPRPGDATTRKAASPRQMVRAAAHVREVMSSCRTKTRKPSVKTSSSTRMGCTTDRGPKYRARAWNPNVPMRNSAPRSHTGWRTRSIAARQPGRAPVLQRFTTASRCRTALHAFDSADKTAKTIAAVIVAVLASPRGALGRDGLRLRGELQLPRQPRQRIGEGLLPEGEVVAARGRRQAGADPGGDGQGLQGMGGLEGRGVLGTGLEPAGQPGETLLRQDVGRVVGVVAGGRAAEQGLDGLLLAVALVGGRLVAGIVAEGRVYLGVVQGQGGGAQAALRQPGYGDRSRRGAGVEVLPHVLRHGLGQVRLDVAVHRAVDA